MNGPLYHAAALQARSFYVHLSACPFVCQMRAFDKTKAPSEKKFNQKFNPFYPKFWAKVTHRVKHVHFQSMFARSAASQQ